MAAQTTAPALTPAQAVNVFSAFLKARCVDELVAVMLERELNAHYGVKIDAMLLLNFNMMLAHKTFEDPVTYLPLFDDACRLAQTDLLSSHPRGEELRVKNMVHARLDFHRIRHLALNPPLKSIRARHIGKLITGLPRLSEAVKLFECTKCRHRFSQAIDLETNDIPPLPEECPSAQGCPGTKFNPISEGADALLWDYQEIRVQEHMLRLEFGASPCSVTVLLQADLVSVVRPGDDVDIVGVVRRRWRACKPDTKPDLELVVHANRICIANERKVASQATPEEIECFRAFWRDNAARPLEARNRILNCICPQVFGLAAVKLAVALTLISGVAKSVEGGTAIRGESHLLIVGDPGTGKSQFLKYAARLAPRAVYTTGRGSSAAGLTAAAVCDGPEWVFEAGALVLADGGLCCIDEFDTIREGERVAIHEAMEQQTLSLAKAGMVTTLRSRTSVFGVCNPKGGYDRKQSLPVNVSVAGPLLSRFDIVLILEDRKDPEWDGIVSQHILDLHTAASSSAGQPGRAGGAPSPSQPQAPPAQPPAQSQRPATQARAPPQGPATQGSSHLGAAAWSMDLLQKYIGFVRSELAPTLSREAEAVLGGYYQMQRRAQGRSAARTTVRMLESLIRLTQAHARLMFRAEAALEDAAQAVLLMESSTLLESQVVGTDPVQADFPADADGSARDAEARILRAIAGGLGGDWLRERLGRELITNGEDGGGDGDGRDDNGGAGGGGGGGPWGAGAGGAGGGGSQGRPQPPEAPAQGARPRGRTWDEYFGEEGGGRAPAAAAGGQWPAQEPVAGPADRGRGGESPASCDDPWAAFDGGEPQPLPKQPRGGGGGVGGGGASGDWRALPPGSGALHEAAGAWGGLAGGCSGRQESSRGEEDWAATWVSPPRSAPLERQQQAPAQGGAAEGDWDAGVFSPPRAAASAGPAAVPSAPSAGPFGDGERWEVLSQRPPHRPQPEPAAPPGGWGGGDRAPGAPSDAEEEEDFEVVPTQEEAGLSPYSLAMNAERKKRLRTESGAAVAPGWEGRGQGAAGAASPHRRLLFAQGADAAAAGVVIAPPRGWGACSRGDENARGASAAKAAPPGGAAAASHNSREPLAEPGAGSPPLAPAAETASARGQEEAAWDAQWGDEEEGWQ